MNNLSVLIVDDEPLARRRLMRLLKKIVWIERIDEAENVQQARAMIDNCLPDILLLDIQMPDGSGFEVLRKISQAPPAVIFVTAFDHHALRAFEENAIDYITKPIEAGRFQLAMDRARNKLTTHSHAEKIVELQETVASLRAAVGDRSRRPVDFWVKGHGEYLRIPSESIIRFQADRDYVRIHVDGGDYLYHESLASLERRLDEADFMRIHRSTIVRRSAVVRVKAAPFSAFIAILRDGSEARVGRTYKSALWASLGHS